MPPSVPANPLTGLSVLPLSLSTAFSRSMEFATSLNEYPDGSSQRRMMISNGGDRTDVLPRLRWKLSKRLPPAALTALRDFYDARGGPAEPFLFYDAYGGVGIGNFDPMGGDPDGRYVVHFSGDWQQQTTPGRSNAAIELVELPLAYGSGTLNFDSAAESGNLVIAGIL